jgi:hypothetical protein
LPLLCIRKKKRRSDGENCVIAPTLNMAGLQ